jgi:hypothetical protein
MSQGASEVPTAATESALGSASEGDLAESPLLRPGPSGHSADPEAPLADALEQRTALPGSEEQGDGTAVVPYDAEPADVAEQATPAGFDEDDYR